MIPPTTEPTELAGLYGRQQAGRRASGELQDRQSSFKHCVQQYTGARELLIQGFSRCLPLNGRPLTYSHRALLGAARDRGPQARSLSSTSQPARAQLGRRVKSGRALIEPSATVYSVARSSSLPPQTLIPSSSWVGPGRQLAVRCVACAALASFHIAAEPQPGTQPQALLAICAEDMQMNRSRWAVHLLWRPCGFVESVTEPRATRQPGLCHHHSRAPRRSLLTASHI